MKDLQYYKSKYDPIAGQWYIKEQLGKGGFGQVFRIEKKDISGTYSAALKIITIPTSDEEVEKVREMLGDERSVNEYFENLTRTLVSEFQLMSRLKGHSNVVSYEDHSIFKHENGIGHDILIRMELLTPLSRVLDRLNELDVIHIGIDICKALEVCQKYNIVHRDIKPDNIFISDRSDYKLGDFGVAKTIGAEVTYMTSSGTSTYMAPELRRGEQCTVNVDIYSLGMVMYKLLNHNRDPFLPLPPERFTFEQREAATIRRMRGETLPPPAQASKAMADIIMKACAFDPRARFETPYALRTALEALLRSGSFNTVNDPATTAMNPAAAIPPQATNPRTATVNARPAVDPRTAAPARPVADPRTAASARPATDPRTAASARPVADPRTAASARPIADPRTAASARPATDPRTAASASPIIDARSASRSTPAAQPAAPVKPAQPAPQEPESQGRSKVGKVFLIIGIAVSAFILMLIFLIAIASAGSSDDYDDYDYSYNSDGFDIGNIDSENTLATDDIHNNRALSYNKVINPTGTQSEDTFASPEGWSVQYVTFSQMIRDCKQFSLQFSVSDITSGSPYGKWFIYAKNYRGKWIYVGSIDHDASVGENAVDTVITPISGNYFEDFDALALVRGSSEPCDHTYEYVFYDFIIDDNCLTIGATGEYLTEHLDSDGNWSGFDVDLANYVCNELGIDYEFVQVDFDQREEALKNDTIDCYWSGDSGTLEAFDNTIVYASANVTYTDEEGVEETVEEHFSVIFNDGNDTLVERVNEILQQAKDDGTIDTLAQQHGIILND